MKRRLLLREPIGVALETLRAHKMRSFLMLLGIILSVSTLIVVIALISGVNRYIADRVANLGSNVFLLTRFPIITDVEEYVKANRRNKKVTWDDFEALRDNMKLPLRVGVELRIDGKVRAGSHSLNDTNIRGVTANMADIDPVVPRDGRYISEGDDQSRALVTMIGNDLATQLFPGVDPIGHELLIDGRPFQVVGIAKTIGTAFGQSQDNFAYIPIQTYFKMDGTDARRSASHDARAPPPLPQRERQFRYIRPGHADGVMEKFDGRHRYRHGWHRVRLPGNRRRGHHERDARHGHRADARNRHPQSPRRPPQRHSPAIPRRSGGDGCRGRSYWRRRRL